MLWRVVLAVALSCERSSFSLSRKVLKACTCDAWGATYVGVVQVLIDEQQELKY